MVEHELKHRQGMISDLMAGSRRWENENVERRAGPGGAARPYHSETVQQPKNLEPTARRCSSVQEDYSVRREPIAEYPPTRLFDHHERLDEREDRIDRNAQDMLLVRSSGRTESPLSQSSTYDSAWGGSRATQSSWSSYPTDPSSVQSTTSERRRDLGPAVARFPPRHSTSDNGGSDQASSHATQPYTDPRTGQRVMMGARLVAPETLAPGSARQRIHDPPDWDETPNFRGFARDP